MNNLDINTDKGQISLRDEHIMHEHIKKCWGVDIIETDKYTDPSIDGLLTVDNTIVGIFESKCRYNITLEILKNWNTWLITFDKLEKGKILSKILKVPFFGFLYLVEDGVFYYWKITNFDGEFMVKFYVERTTTQKSTNGGSIIRPNAYLQFSNYANEILESNDFEIISVSK